MAQDQIDPLGTIPMELDELGAAFKARDAEIIKTVNANQRLMVARFDEGDGRFNRLEEDLAENTRQTKKIASTVSTLSNDLGDMIEVAKAAKGAIKVLNWIGALAKPLGYIAIFVGACVSAYTAVKAGLGIK